MKAFDTVPHGHLIQVLNYYSFDVSVVNLSRSVWAEDGRELWLMNLNPHDAMTYDVKRDIPQGSLLGPVLLMIYTNTIVDRNSRFYSIYADDTKVLYDISNVNDVEALQAGLNNILNWSNESLNIAFHPVKCHGVHDNWEIAIRQIWVMRLVPTWSKVKIRRGKRSEGCIWYELKFW